MGLDLTLGALILVAGVRGWFKGFFLQAIGLSSLVAGVYLADPVRDFARPHARQYLTGMQPDLLDKLLWWASAVLACLVVSGVGKGILKVSRRSPYGGEPEPNRGDQGAGFLLGGLKGAVVASFVAAALMKYSPEYLKAGGYVGEQVQSSRALAWSQQYRPAERIWNAPPVQSFVARVRARGLWNESPGKPAAEASEARTADAAERPRTMALPGRLNPSDPDFVGRLDAILEREGLAKSR